MSISVTFNNTHRITLASPFFMTRRPVLDRRQELEAYELLFCSAAGDSAGALDDTDGAVSVIADVIRHGLSRVIGDVPGFVHVNSAALMSDIFNFLPPQSVVPVIANGVEPSPEVLNRIAQLVRSGFRFALDVDKQERTLPAFLPLVDILKVDTSGKIAAELAVICGRLHPHRKTVMAENVHTAQQFQLCCDAGFDIFQGYYFCRQQITPARKLKASQAAIIRLITLLASDADTVDIEDGIKHEPTLGLNLLRLVNTPAVSAHRIDSLHQALMVLGRNQLQRWLQIMLYAPAGPQGTRMMPLLTQATTRGRLLELAAQKLRPGNRGIADTAFTVGIMSLMDSLFGMPMEEILMQMPVTKEVGDALLYRRGYFGELLVLAEQTEWADKGATELLHGIEGLRLSHHDLYALQLAAFEWSDQVTRHV
ncbi:EAL and HDOD domain-containing protein [Noviherbaspirillum sp.]|uniref:EAL and HDOD domain-containing protein n=1 Tax=Noviherbaspirillum sp. TaxID=1926288 RepID=UPI002FE3783C